MTAPPWKKILLIGGLVMLLGLGLCAGSVALVLRSIKSTGAYSEAVALASSDPRVAAEIGGPVRPDWYVLGSVKLVNDAGHADLSIPLIGTKTMGGTPRTGRLIVAADRAGGVWTLRKVDLVTMTGPDEPHTIPLKP